MKPVIIFRFLAHEGPGYLGDFLSAQNLEWQLIKVDEGEPLPASILAYSGMVLMGGPMSVNDDLPWIAPELALIRQAVERGIPVIGHCLGGQLLSKAMDGVVSSNPVKEIGWGDVRVTDADSAKDWVGNGDQALRVFHWHGETFSIPPHAIRILDSAHCANQAFILDNRHIGLQCHVEMTPQMIRAWCESGAAEIAASPGPAVQSAAVMQTDLQTQTRQLHAIADKIYSRWIQGLPQ